MFGAIRRGATLAAFVNLALWVLASIAGVVPPIADTVPTVVGIAVASAGGVAAAGIVANRFTGVGARRRWNRVAWVVLVLSIGSPIGLALGAIPVSPIDPTNPLLISFKGGIAAVYAVMHVTTFFAVQRTIAQEVKE